MTETPTIYPALVRVVCDGPPSAFVRVVDRDELRRHVRGLLAEDRQRHVFDDRLVVFIDAIVGVLERDGRWCDGDAGASIELLRGPYPARVRSWIGTDADPEEVVVDREGLVAKVRDVFFFGVDQVISDGPAQAIVDGIEERLTVYGGRVAIDTTRDADRGLDVQPFEPVPHYPLASNGPCYVPTKDDDGSGVHLRLAWAPPPEGPCIR